MFLKCSLILRWQRLESLLQSSVSHEPSEIILIRWFTAQETFPSIINVQTAVLLSIFAEIQINIKRVFTVTIDQFNASLWINFLIIKKYIW